jgi:hypothetical protein
MKKMVSFFIKDSDKKALQNVILQGFFVEILRGINLFYNFISQQSSQSCVRLTTCFATFASKKNIFVLF